MSDEPSQKVMLYFLELLINTKKTFPVSQLAGHLGNGLFTAQMRVAAGVNEKGLREFLLRYPSLFTVLGNNVSLYCGEDDKPGRQPDAGSNPSPSILPDVDLELETVKYLAHKLAKHRGNWVAIQCLTGHFSQMTAEMRRVLGPQAELKKFLLRYEHVFEVSVNSVRLREELETVFSLEPESFKFIPPATFKDPALFSMFRTGMDSMEETHQNNGSSLHETNADSHSNRCKQHSQANQDEDTVFVTPNNTSNTNANNYNRADLRPSSMKQCSASVNMTLPEYSAVVFLKNYLEEKGCLKVCGLMEYVEQRAADTIRHFLGPSKPHFENFIKKYPQIFSISSEEIVGLVKNAKLCVIVTSCAEHSRNVEEFRKFQKLLELDPETVWRLDNPKLIKPVREIQPDKENVTNSSEERSKKPIGALRDLKNLTFDSSIHRSHRRNFPALQKSRTVDDRVKTYASVGCQTLTTGDIIATQFYLGN